MAYLPSFAACLVAHGLLFKRAHDVACNCSASSSGGAASHVYPPPGAALVWLAGGAAGGGRSGRSGPGVKNFSDIQIRVKQSTYGDWPSFEAAYSEGERFALTRVDQDVSCATSNCLKTEIVGIDLTTDLLRELAERQVLSFKIVGRRGSMLVEIPQSYVAGFLAAVDEAEASDKGPKL